MLKLPPAPQGSSPHGNSSSKTACPLPKCLHPGVGSAPPHPRPRSFGRPPSALTTRPPASRSAGLPLPCLQRGPQRGRPQRVASRALRGHVPHADDVTAGHERRVHLLGSSRLFSALARPALSLSRSLWPSLVCVASLCDPRAVRGLMGDRRGPGPGQFPRRWPFPTNMGKQSGGD